VIRRVILCTLAVLLLAGLAGPAYARVNTTTYTYTLSVESDAHWIRTQDAYIPAVIYLQGELNQPEYMFVHGGLIYVADTGHGRIVVFDPADGSIEYFGRGTLGAPTGLFVRDDGWVYVADTRREAVFVFNERREAVMTLTRPESFLFSEWTAYRPRNVAVSESGTIYVLGIGTDEGLMMFDASGEFQGFFGANPRNLSWIETLREIYQTEIQRSNELLRRPNEIRNFTISGRGIVYTVTQSPEGNAVRMLNRAGADIMDRAQSMVNEQNFVDIAVNRIGNIFAVSATGVITEYDPSGQVVFSLGGIALSSDRSGLFSTPISIDVDDNGFLYVLDRERGLIQVFYPTEFALATHRAIEAYENGNFAGSFDLWADLLRYNGLSKIAQNGLGRSLFALRDYTAAREAFQFTFNRPDYSDAFWEIRNDWILGNIGTVFWGLIILYFILRAVRFYNKKTGNVTRFKEAMGAGIRKCEPLRDALYIKTVLRHPVDSYYDLKHGIRGSVLSATLVYAIAFAMFCCDFLLRGFLFRHFNNLSGYNWYDFPLMFFIPCALWVVGNYMVSTINEGEGSLKNVYVCTAYALAPYIILTPVTILLTHICTLNEAFLVTFSMMVSIGWTAVYLMVMVMEIHSLTFGGALKNILVTLFTIVTALAGFMLIYIMGKAAWDFFMDLGREVMYRAI
jgi:DNA-binding beta-propeller fold protein YncE